MQSVAEIHAAVEAAEQLAIDADIDGGDHPDETFEAGVYAALCWVVGDGPHPLDTAYPAAQPDVIAAIARAVASDEIVEMQKEPR